MNDTGKPAEVWLLQDGEPLPIDPSPRLMRTGDMARRLVKAGYEVTWWTSRFAHNLKSFRGHPKTFYAQDPGYTIALLDGPGYATNISWQRIRHYRSIAAHFAQLAESLPVPAIVLGSYPSPELCDAGRRYAHSHNVPFVVDIRDPWPDIFPEYMPRPLRWSLFPVLWYYRRKMRRIAKHAAGIVAVSEAMLEWGVKYSGRSKREMDHVFHIGSHRHGQDRPIVVPSRFTASEPLTCLFATTCGKSYDGEMLVDAARILESLEESRIRFIISGDGDMRAHWQARAEGLKSIHFTGWIPHEELQAHFRSSHLGLVLLKGGIARFWLGNKIFEYMAAFLGLINDVQGEPSNIVEGRGLGINVDRENPSSLANALRSLIDDPNRVRIFMERSKRAFMSEFDREAVETNYVSYLATLMNGNQRRQRGTSA